MSKSLYVITQNHASEGVEALLEVCSIKPSLYVFEIDEFLTRRVSSDIPPEDVIALFLTCGKAYEALKPFTTRNPLIFDVDSAQRWARFLVQPQPTLWVGHGDHSGKTKPYYKMLEKEMQLIHSQQFIFLLSDDWASLKTVIKSCGQKIVLRSLFLTNGHHARFDMNQRIKDELQSFGVELTCDTTPLLAYPEVVETFLAMSKV